MNLTYLSIGIILAAPVAAAANVPFTWVENIFVRLLLVFYCILSIRQGPFEGVLGLLAVFSLLIERNHEVLRKFPGQKPIWPSTGNGGIPTQRQPLPAVVSEHSYEPPHPEEKSLAVAERHGEKDSEDLFESAEDLTDSNPRLPEVAQGEAAAGFYESRGVA